MKRIPVGLALSFMLCAGCSSTSTSPASVACRGTDDACLTVTVTNTDFAGYSTTSEPDGNGNIYLALIDTCPSFANPQYRFVSNATKIADADLAAANSYNARLGVKFADPAFKTTYQEGDTVYLSGFLDDNDSVTTPDTTVPGLGDTIFNCVEFTLVKGSSQIATPLVPCLLDKLPPYYFHQSGFPVDCSDLQPGDGGLGGAGGGAGADGG